MSNFKMPSLQLKEFSKKVVALVDISISLLDFARNLKRSDRQPVLGGFKCLRKHDSLQVV